jgi:hypothetical protein
MTIMKTMTIAIAIPALAPVENPELFDLSSGPVVGVSIGGCVLVEESVSDAVVVGVEDTEGGQGYPKRLCLGRKYPNPSGQQISLPQTLL